MSVIRAIATMLVLALGLSVLFKTSSPPSAAQVQAAQVVAKLPFTSPAAALPTTAVATAALAPKVIPPLPAAEPPASPGAAKPTTYTAQNVQPQAPLRQAVAPPMPMRLDSPAGAQPKKARQVALSAHSQQPTTQRDQQRAAESNPPPHPKVSHLSLLPRTASNTSSPSDRKSSAPTSGNHKPALSRMSQPPTQRDRYAPSSPDRNISRPNTMPPDDRKNQSRYIPSRSASLYDTRRYDQNSQSHTGPNQADSYQRALHDNDRQSPKSDRHADRFNGRVQLSDSKRRMLLREYEETARRQLEIRRELGRNVSARLSRNDRYSDASSRGE